MNVEYVGTLKSVVPSAGSAVVETGTVLEGLSEVEAAALLMVPELWLAADAEAEAVTPGWPSVPVMDKGLEDYSAGQVVTGGMQRVYRGIVYQAHYASVGETPDVAVHCWDEISPQPGGYLTEGSSQTNTFLGEGALSSVTGQGNVAVGWLTGENVTTGSVNVLVGAAAGNQLSTGSSNTFVGVGAGQSATTLDGSVVIGVGAAPRLETGEANIIIGPFAAEGITSATGLFAVQFGSSPPLIEGDLLETKIGFLGAVPVKRPKIGAEAAGTSIGKALVELGLAEA